MSPTDTDPDPATPDPATPDDQVDSRVFGRNGDTEHSRVTTELRRLRSLLG